MQFKGPQAHASSASGSESISFIEIIELWYDFWKNMLFQTKLLLKNDVFSGLKVISFQHLQWVLNTPLPICMNTYKDIQVMLSISKKHNASIYSDLENVALLFKNLQL